MRMGHVHLHVGESRRACCFLPRPARLRGHGRTSVSAAFVSAGGYHHHLGFNVWLGKDVKLRPDRTAGLRHWVVVLERPEEVEAVRERVRAAGLPVEEREGGFLVRDPWETPVVVSTTPDA